MNSSWEVIPMTEEHLSRLAELEKICFSLPWSREALEEEVHNSASRFFTAVRGGAIGGYAGMQGAAGEYYVCNVAVFPEYRRQGIGGRLMDALLRCAERENGEFVSLEVRASNTGAIQLYEKHGFEMAGIRPGFYSGPREDAVIMTYKVKEKIENRKNL